MKQTLTRDGFAHALLGERSDKARNNLLIIGHAIFDLHDAVKELLERTKDLYPPTDFKGPKIKALKIAPLTPEEEVVATKEQELIDKKTGVTDASKSDDDIESF